MRNFWINPDGKAESIGTTHIAAIRKNPEHYGVESHDPTPILAALRNGWIRVSHYLSATNFELVDLDEWKIWCMRMFTHAQPDEHEILIAIARPTRAEPLRETQIDTTAGGLRSEKTYMWTQNPRRSRRQRKG